jgi:hypothetical protein
MATNIKLESATAEYLVAFPVVFVYEVRADRGGFSLMSQRSGF